MDDLCGSYIQTLQKSNEDFLKQSTLFENGGLYSKSEVKWYQEMMVEINNQLEEQMKKRTEKKEKMIDRLKKVREKHF